MILTPKRYLVILTTAVLLLLFTTTYWMSGSLATGDGTSGYSGNPTTNGGETCIACHVSGALQPEVNFEGPTQVLPGVKNAYRLTITGGPAQTAGMNISEDLGVLAPITDTKVLDGELTHIHPSTGFNSDGELAFGFAWTAPEGAESSTLYGAGLSSDGDETSAGDGVATTTLDVQIGDSGIAPNEIALVPVTTVSQRVSDITHAGDQRLFIVEQAGRIRIVNSEGTLLPIPYLDITATVDSSSNEEGLLGLAFHPNYSDNGYFYVNYTYTYAMGARVTRVVRYTVDGTNTNVAIVGSALIILEFTQPYPNHNGGAIQFGGDGYLYIATGDGGGGFDPDDNSQDTSVLLGKLLRIDVNSDGGSLPACDESAGSNYRIPPSNPFAGSDPDTCDEIWALGLRNPWRISFDRETGDLWIADVGQNLHEEINYEPANHVGGRNYGWDCYEGFTSNTNNPSPLCTENADDYELPIHQYDHEDDPCSGSVTGGYVYRGSELSGLQGHYIFADFCTGKMWALGGAIENPTVSALQPDFVYISTFGEDASGEMYVAANNNVYKITDPDDAAVAPATTITALAGGSVRLDWTGDIANCAYEIHSSDAPYFTPNGLNTKLHDMLSSATPQYIVPFAAGDPAGNRFFSLRAVNCSGLSAVTTQTVGVVDYALVSNN